MRIYTRTQSPLGSILLTADGTHLTGVYFAGQKYEAHPSADWREDRDLPVLRQAVEQLRAYFDGKLTRFDLPLKLHGTPFQQRVWQALCSIPSGTTCTYGAIARAVGAPEAVRAVGAAVGRNPISVIVPCHRVVGADGTLTGYAGGLDRKRALLALERARPATHAARQGDLALA